MAPIVPIGEPATVRAGLTLTWRVSDPEFPVAESWTLSYAIRGASAPTWDASWVDSSTGEYVVTLPPAITALLTAGTYQWAVIYTKAGAKYSPRDGVFTVETDLVAAEAGDVQSMAERAIALLEAQYLELAAQKIDAYSIGQRQAHYRTMDEVSRQLGIQRARLGRERSPNDLGRRIVARFTNPVVSPRLGVPGDTLA